MPPPYRAITHYLKQGGYFTALACGYSKKTDIHFSPPEGKLTRDQELHMAEIKPEEELYNLLKDPNEFKNLMEDPEYRPILDSLRPIIY